MTFSSDPDLKFLEPNLMRVKNFLHFVENEFSNGALPVYPAAIENLKQHMTKGNEDFGQKNKRGQTEADKTKSALKTLLGNGDLSSSSSESSR